MKLKKHHEKALRLIQTIWRDDIEYGQIVYNGEDRFSELTVPDEKDDMDVMNLSGCENLKLYNTDSYRAIFLLRDCELIDELKENRILKLSVELDSLFKMSEEDAEEIVEGMDDDYRDQLVDYMRYKNLSEEFPDEIINDSYVFRVTDKCKKATYEELEEIIINHSRIEQDPIIGEFNDVQLKKSGVITHRKSKIGKISPVSHQYNLFRALLSQKDKTRFMTTKRILEFLGKPTEGDPTLYLPTDTVKNLRGTFSRYNIPIRLRKKDDCFMLEEKDLKTT